MKKLIKPKFLSFATWDSKFILTLLIFCSLLCEGYNQTEVCRLNRHGEILQKRDTFSLDLNLAKIAEKLRTSREVMKIITICSNEKNCWTFELEKSTLIAEGANITLHESGRNSTIPIKGFYTFRGTVSGKLNSKAYFILSPNQLRGRFTCDNKSYIIRSATNKMLHEQSKYLLIATKDEGIYDEEKVMPPLEECDGCTGGPCPNCYVHQANRICRDQVNGNNAFCETIPLYDLDYLEDYPNVEVAGDIDYEFFSLYNSGLPHTDYPTLDEGVVLEVVDILSYVTNSYVEYFKTSIWLVHLNVWATPDNYNNSSDITLLNSVENYWNSHKQCIHRDAVHLFSGALLGYDGAARGDVCNGGETAYSVTSHYLGDTYRTGKSVTHEMGHHLGGYHDDHQMCCELCNVLQDVVMCSDGILGSSGYIWSEISQYTVKKRIYSEGLVDCLTGVSTSFEVECTECIPVITITADNPSPLLDCGERDIINFTIEVCNYCDESVEWELGARFTTTTMEVENLGDFETTQANGLFTEIIGEPVYLLPNNCATFHFTGKMVDVPTSQTLGVTPLINDEDYSQYKLSLSILEYIDEIGGPSTQSLDGLITTDTNFPPYHFLDNGCITWGGPFKKNKTIVEKLEIDIPEYCMDGFNFKMEPGSEIIVKTGSRLTIMNSKLFACTDMWKGITVEDGAILEVDNCTIEDAQYGIRSPYGGASIFVTNSDFNRNFVGVYLDGPAVGDLTTLGAFFGNTFDGGSGLLTPYTGQSAAPAISIGSKSFAGVWVQTKAMPINSFENIFKNLTNGIYVNQTNLALNRCQFFNIQENGYADWTAGYGVRGLDYNNSYAHHFNCTGFGMNSETFSFFNCSKGIRIEGMNVGKINRNAIDAVRGIELINCYPSATVFSNRVITQKVGMKFSHMQPGTNANISFNKVEVEDSKAIGMQINMMGVPPTGANGIKIKDNNIFLKNDFTLGIESNGGNGLIVADNVVEADRLLAFYSGIRINNDQKSYFLCNTVQTGFPEWNGTYGLNVWDAEATKYSCNVVTNLGSGVAFEMGSFTPENLSETSFSGFNVGLYVSDAAAIGSQTHRGNEWASGSLGSYGAKHGSSDPNDWDNSLFTVHTGSVGAYRPSLPSGQNDWFTTDISGTPSNACPTCLPPSPPTPGPGDDELFPVPDDNIATGNFNTTAFNSEITKLANRYLFRKLSADTSLITTGGLAYASFYDTQDTAATGRFYKVETAIKELYNTGSLAEAQVADNFEDIALLMEEVNSLDSIAWSAGIVPTYWPQRDSVLQVVQSLSNYNDTLMQPIIAQRILDVDTVEQLNNTITILGGDVPGWNEREVNRIFLTTVAVAIDTIVFDEVDLLTLDSIAAQCPLTGGSAVFKARSLLALVRDSMYDDVELCEPTEERQNAFVGSKESPFQVFPNPAQNDITLLLKDASQVEIRVIIYNALGATVLEKAFPCLTNILKIDVSMIGEGPILVSLYRGSKQIGSQKVLLIH